MKVFMECTSCAAKPGSPVLCPACLHNRGLIAELNVEVYEARTEGWNAAVEACVEIADKDAAMDYTASMIRVQIMGLLITDKTCVFSTAKAEYPTDKRSLGLRFVEDGHSYLDAISGEDVCNDESCIGCRITKLLFEVESRWKPEIVKAEAAKAE